MVTSTEENYLKAIYNLSLDRNGKGLGTNELADYLQITPATACQMLKKLKKKGLISYKKYGGIALNDSGREVAILVFRKHRLWETFLYVKLEFTWDEIHEVAEQLEHIKSKKLVDQLDKLLDYPEYDPHGDPIPKANGVSRTAFKKTLFNAELGKTYKIVAVKDSSSVFLQYATEIGIGIDVEILTKSRRDFDGFMEIEIGGVIRTISPKVAENVYVD
ncbi:MAG: metal-dependent transcriptional regulator [Bacteroidetes bacterium]|nr:metal-dependent transcriptional regulator [Bacteroidota bacterium]